MSDSVEVSLEKRSVLAVCRKGDTLTLDFPSRPPKPAAIPDALVRGLGKKPVQVLKARDYFALYETAEDVRSLNPDIALLGTLDEKVIVTAPGDNCDFVSRFFAPTAGVPEDPVTGSAHCTLIPYWSARLGKTKMFARQLSKRGGELFCELAGERVLIGGKAVLYSSGQIEIDDASRAECTEYMKSKFKLVEGAVVAPKGFKAAGVFCDINRLGTGKGSNKGNKRDLALIVSDAAATVAGMFTTNQVCAAPVKVCVERMKSGKAQAVVVNSGECRTTRPGKQGMVDAREIGWVFRNERGIDFAERFGALMGSTGRIGVTMPMDNRSHGNY